MGACEAGALLSTLLLENPDYRRRWRGHARRHAQSVQVAAVCRVIADYLWESGERPDSMIDLPRRLRDLVARALTGKVVTLATLQWFTGAFAMTASDRARLTAALTEGARGARVFTGDTRAHTAPQDGLDILTGHHTCLISAGGDVERHEYLLVVEAIVDGSDILRAHLPEPTPGRPTARTMPEVRVDQGGTLERVEVLEGGGGWYQVRLHRPLLRGETASVRAVVRCEPALQPVRRPLAPRGSAGLRQPLTHRTANLALHVQFADGRRPRQVAFAAWTNPHTVVPDTTDAIELLPDGSGHWFVSLAENADVGWIWEWDDDVPPRETSG